MDKMTKKIITAFVVMVAVAAAILAGYYMLGKVEIADKGEEAPKTEVEKLKAKDLELKYPGTPSEVVKLYWRINKCIYNETMKDEDLEALMKQLRMTYDEELLAADGNSYDEMLETFKKDKEAFQKSKRFISSCIVDDDKKVKYATLKGKECATLQTNTLETQGGSKSTRTAEEFMCRKDSDGKWKILGWTVSSGEKDEEDS